MAQTVSMPGPFVPQVSSVEPTFTEVQAAWGTNVSSGTTVSATLTNAPAAGNAVICVPVFYPLSLTVSTIKDNAGTPNSYTVTPHSPSNAQSGADGLSFAYLINVPSGAGKTITATMSGTITWTVISSARNFTVRRERGVLTPTWRATVRQERPRTRRQFRLRSQVSFFTVPRRLAGPLISVALGGSWTQSAAGILPVDGGSIGGI